ncbi:chymotrypsin-1-like [Leguminivora glycinivorella]|uniref:chymotrypsin-1-like n=1 Tax=Leguminivora glycinivorella TaxID=1035111 RepID=UPI00200E7A18|nr:chymotrypsin-1-like [Leguminivora glycinivorella]
MAVLWVVVLWVLPMIWGSGLESNTVNNYGIYGGHEIPIEDAPYMVGVYASTFLYWVFRFKCGGSIIHEKFVLTAAHCAVDFLSVKVSIGSDHLDQGDFINVDARITRTDYDDSKLFGDICLLKLVKSIQFGPRMAAVKIPDEGFELDAFTMVNVTGWGKTEKSSMAATTLRQVTIQVLPEWYCPLNTVICAGTKGEGTCNGDSGGPLVYNNILIGLVSYRRQENCAGPYGTVYTRVARYSEWIKSHLP